MDEEGAQVTLPCECPSTVWHMTLCGPCNFICSLLMNLQILKMYSLLIPNSLHGMVETLTSTGGGPAIWGNSCALF